MLTKIKLRDGTEYEFQNVKDFGQSPGILMFVNHEGRPIITINQGEFISAVHPENDTDLVLVPPSKLIS